MFHIIMCTYNAQRFLAEQLESIARSTIKDWVLHVFDDGSTDNTISMIDRFRETHSANCVEINNNPHNLGAWRNFLVAVKAVGADIVENDYIMLADQDDIWNDDKIAVTYNAMKGLEERYGAEEPLLVSTDVTLVDEDKNLLSKSYAQRNNFNTAHKDFSHAVMENHAQGCTIMINKALAECITEIPNEATMHDSWLSLVATALGHTAYVDEQTMLYRDSNKSVTGHNETYEEDIRSKFFNLNKQRQILLTPVPMYKELKRIYEKKLPETVLDILEAYIGFENNGFFRKRYDIIRLRMWKTGIVRNIGLLVMV